MSQCDRILAVLADGRPHSFRDVHARVGTCRLNSRVAELRSRGHRIECVKKDGDYVYRLTAQPLGDETSRILPANGPYVAGLGADAAGVSSPNGLGSAATGAQPPDEGVSMGAAQLLGSDATGAQPAESVALSDDSTATDASQLSLLPVQARRFDDRDMVA